MGKEELTEKELMLIASLRSQQSKKGQIIHCVSMGLLILLAIFWSGFRNNLLKNWPLFSILLYVAISRYFTDRSLIKIIDKLEG